MNKPKTLKFQGYNVIIGVDGTIKCDYESDSIRKNLLFSRALVKYLLSEGFEERLNGCLESIDKKLSEIEQE